MKTIHLLKLPLFIALALITFVTFNSCTKDDEEPSVDTEMAKSDMEAETIFDEIDQAADAGLQKENVEVNGRLYGAEPTIYDSLICSAAITHDATAKKVTIDFGAGCTDFKGRVRTGKIIIAYTSTSITSTLDSYTVDGVKVEGTRLITKAGATSWSVVVTGGKITWLDGTSSTFTIAQTRTVKLNALLNYWDDEFGITGTVTGENRNGKAFVSTINDEILFRRACLLAKVFIPVKGSKTIVVTDGTVTSYDVDFGTGACDNKVSVSSGNSAVEIEFGKK